MPRRPLQVIGHGIVVLETEVVADHVGHDRRHAAQLGVAEGIPRSGFRQELAILVGCALADHDDAVVVLLHTLAHPLEKRALVEGNLGEQDDVRRIARFLARQAARRCDPAGMPAHDLENEDLGRGLRHRQDVESSLLRRHRDVFRDRPEARAVIGNGEVIVHGLGNAQAGHREAHLPGNERHLVGGVHRVVAAVVEEIADVVRPEDLDKALILGPVFLDAPELVTCRPESTTGRMPQRCNRARALLVGIDHVLGQRADDAVATGIDVGDLVPVFPRGFDHPAGGGVDDGGYASRLRVERVSCWHESMVPVTGSGKLWSISLIDANP